MIVPGRTLVAGRFTNPCETGNWGWGWKYREQDRTGWSSDMIEAARQAEIQRIRHLTRAARTIKRADSSDWD